MQTHEQPRDSCDLHGNMGTSARGKVDEMRIMSCMPTHETTRMGLVLQEAICCDTSTQHDFWGAPGVSLFAVQAPTLISPAVFRSPDY